MQATCHLGVETYWGQLEHTGAKNNTGFVEAIDCNVGYSHCVWSSDALHDGVGRHSAVQGLLQHDLYSVKTTSLEYMSLSGLSRMHWLR